MPKMAMQLDTHIHWARSLELLCWRAILRQLCHNIDQGIEGQKTICVGYPLFPCERLFQSETFPVVPVSLSQL